MRKPYWRLRFNVWLSITGTPAHDGWPEPPFEIEDPTQPIGTLVKIESDLDIQKLFNTWCSLPGMTSANLFEYTSFLCHPRHLVENSIQDLFHRKNYCDKYPAVPPFPGSYDDQPAWWFDVLGIIETETELATGFVNRKQGK